MATRTKLTISNKFHATEATVMALDGVISRRAMVRASRKLCGIAECRCGWNAPMRSAHDAAGNAFTIHPDSRYTDRFLVSRD